MKTFLDFLIRQERKANLQTKIITVFNGKRTIKLKAHVADTQEKREKGLMFIETLPKNEGMLFVFPEKTYGGFWMKNTLIALSIAFLDSNGEIQKILDMFPCKEDECPTYDPEISYYYALEVNIGWFEKNQIKEGDYIKLH
jgi:uncharacterized protein